MDTQAVLEHHLTTLGSGDLEGVLQDYTEQSSILTQGGAFVGLEAIRGFFVAALAGSFKPGTYTFSMDVVRVEGDVAYIVWHASCADMEITLGTDTFVIRDGKIATQTYAAKIESR